MQVTNEIRHAFLHAGLNLYERQATVKRYQITSYLRIAFNANDTEELMVWLTLQEKVAFGRKLLELTGGRDLASDLTEDR